MTQHITLESEEGVYLRQLDVEEIDGDIVLWEMEEIPGVSLHTRRFAIPAHLAAAVAARIMSAVKEAAR